MCKGWPKSKSVRSGQNQNILRHRLRSSRSYCSRSFGMNGWTLTGWETGVDANQAYLYIGFFFQVRGLRSDHIWSLNPPIINWEENSMSDAMTTYVRAKSRRQMPEWQISASRLCRHAISRITQRDTLSPESIFDLKFAEGTHFNLILWSKLTIV